MATSQREPAERGGGALDGRRNNYAFTSLRLPREVSPHMSPDRITRHAASPSQWTIQMEEIVPRVPQMYRTSFSAVTAPTRISRATSPVGNGSFVRTAARSTMPVRLHASKSPPIARSTRPTRISSTRGALPGEQGSCTVSNSGLTYRGSHEGLLSSPRSEEGLLSKGSHERILTTHHSHEGLLNSYSSNDGLISPNGDLNITTDSVFYPVNGDKQKSVMEESVISDTSLDNVLTPVTDYYVNDVKTKTCITKEYVHVLDVEYMKSFQERYPDAQITDIVRSHEALDTDDGNLEASPKEQRKRSSTLPSENLITKPITSTPVKKSLSSSITNFFRKMSPKSLRRKSSNTSKHTDSTFSSSNSINPSENGSLDATHKSKSKSPKGSPIKIKKKSKDSRKTSGAAETALTAQSPVGEQSLRILRSIKDSQQAQQEKSVYQAFKDKQSPRMASEAAVLKPQALRAVEFPDNLLQTDVQVDDVDATSNVPSGSPSQTSTSPSPHRPSPHRRDSSQQGECSPRPPRTLNVREVAKLSLGTWQFPCMSYESIGQCSLDLHNAGSEPSLVSRNGQHSSQNASKRTLNSQENLSPIQRQPVASEPPVLATQTSSSTEELLANASFDTTPKTPSYLKISCAVSGYNNYNKYGSPKESATQSRLKVLTTDQNGSVLHDQSKSSSDLESDSQPISEEQSRSSHHIETDSAPVDEGESVSECQGNGCSPHSNGCDMPDNATMVTHGAMVISDGRTVTQASLNLKSNGNHLPAVNGHDNFGVHADSDNESSKDAVHNQRMQMSHTSMETSQTSELQLDLDDKTPEKPCQTGSPATPAKDGHYFIDSMRREELRMRKMCEEVEPELEQALPEEVSGKLRAAIGKANLLITKKFKQFRGLCDKNISQGEDEPFPTTPQDLAGFWDLVLLQVEDINLKFAEIQEMKKNGWKVQKSPVRSNQTKIGAKTKSPRGKTNDPQRAAKNAEMAKARELARQRLLAAKKAGRERKISESDKDEVQIYVN